MNKGIYFIGGASASGKSTCAHLLAEEFDVNTIELDDIFDVIKQAVGDEDTGVNITNKVAPYCVKQFIKSGVTGILEGGWLNPKQASKIAAQYGSKFQPVYCGYTNADIPARLAMIFERGDHWLAEMDHQEALDWLKDQIEASRWYASGCKKYNLPFFDFSDFTKGCRQLRKHYKSWRAHS